MEQKTEASQAVDDLLYEHARAIMQLREYGHSHDRAENVRAAEDAIRAALKAQPAPTEATEKPFGYFIVEGDDLPYPGSGFIRELAEGRAYRSVTPVYTRPAPTEAAQPARHTLQAEGKHPAPCARHCEATAFGIEIRRLTAENAQLRAAQGEDSARLDAERYRYFRRIYGAEARLIRGPIYIAETPEQFDAGIDECIRYEQEVARASAETGGVKS